MKTRAALVLAGIAGLASVANAQQTQGTVTYTLSPTIYGSGPGSNWTAPVINGNGNSIVDPGEGVLWKITIGMSVAPGAASTQTGTLGGPLTCAPSIQVGSSGTGTNAGFWAGDINLTADNGAASSSGTWSDSSTNYALAVRRRMSVATAGNSGSPNANGSGLTDIQPAQFGGDADAIQHVNNFVTFQGLWIPSASDFGNSLTNHTFVLSLGALGIPSQVAAADSNYDNGYILPVALSVNTVYGANQTVTLAAVPGPSSLALLGLGGLVAARRRRA